MDAPHSATCMYMNVPNLSTHITPSLSQLLPGTFEAFGGQHVHILDTRGDSTRPCPAVSKGCEQWLTLHEHESPAAMAERLHGEGFSVVTTAIGERAVSIDDVDFNALGKGKDHVGVGVGRRRVNGV